MGNLEEKFCGSVHEVSFAVIVTARAGVLAAKGRDGRDRYKFPGLCSAY